MEDSKALVDIIYERAKFVAMYNREVIFRDKVIHVYKHHKHHFSSKRVSLKFAYCAAYLSYYLPIGIRDNITVATEHNK